MKKIFSFAIVLVAAAMVSCGGNNAQKPAEAEAQTECCGTCEKAEGECCEKAEGECCGEGECAEKKAEGECCGKCAEKAEAGEATAE